MFFCSFVLGWVATERLTFLRRYVTASVTLKNGDFCYDFWFQIFQLLSLHFFNGIFYCGSVWRKPVAIATTKTSLPLGSFRGQYDIASGFYCNLISGFLSCDRILICFLKTEMDLLNMIL